MHTLKKYEKKTKSKYYCFKTILSFLLLAPILSILGTIAIIDSIILKLKK